MNSNPVVSEVLTPLTVYFTEQCAEYLTVLWIYCVLGDEYLEQVSN